VPSGSSVSKCPRQESNLVYELRGLACEIRHTPRTSSSEHPAEESDLVLQFRRLPCFHHTRRASFVRADDWICTSIDRFTRPVPRCSATSAISRIARSRTP
jgi:hypothetical protein